MAVMKMTDRVIDRSNTNPDFLYLIISVIKIRDELRYLM